MNAAQYGKANDITEKISRVKRELKIWNNELDKVYKLAYAPASAGFDSKYCCPLGSNIDEALFQAFRTAAINKLKLDILELEREFNNL